MDSFRSRGGTRRGGLTTQERGKQDRGDDDGMQGKRLAAIVNSVLNHHLWLSFCGQTQDRKTAHRRS